MPELADPPAQTEAPASLKALFQIPSNLVETVDPPETQPAPVPPVKPPEKEAPPVAPVDDKKPEEKKPDPSIRLAPDFSKKPEIPAVPAEPEIEITDEMIATAKTPKAQADMRKFREAHVALKKEVETLRNKPVPVPADDTDARLLVTTLTKERDELLAKVEQSNLFDSPKFQREHLMPRQKSFDRLQGIVKESGGDPVMIQRAISLTGKARIDALDEIRAEIGSEMLKGQFDRLVEDIDSRSAEINEKVRNAKQTAQELRQAELLTEEEQRVKLTQQFEGLLASARRDSAENIMPELFTKVDDPNLAWWNEAIDRDDKIAREALLDSTPQKAVYAAVFASKLGTVLEMWRNERKAREAVEQENRELKGAEPTLTAERQAAKVDAAGIEPSDITARLQSGFYKNKS